MQKYLLSHSGPTNFMQNYVSLSHVPLDIFQFLRRFISVVFYSNFVLKSTVTQNTQTSFPGEKLVYVICNTVILIQHMNILPSCLQFTPLHSSLFSLILISVTLPLRAVKDQRVNVCNRNTVECSRGHCCNAKQQCVPQILFSYMSLLTT